MNRIHCYWQRVTDAHHCCMVYTVYFYSFGWIGNCSLPLSISRSALCLFHHCSLSLSLFLSISFYLTVYLSLSVSVSVFVSVSLSLWMCVLPCHTLSFQLFVKSLISLSPYFSVSLCPSLSLRQLRITFCFIT